MSKTQQTFPLLYFRLFNAFERDDIRSCLIGNNAKSILVLVAENQEISDDLLEFLSKILQAVNINLRQDIALLQVTPESSFGFIQMARKFPVEKLLSFGLPAKRLGLHWRYTPYKPIEKINRRFLFAERLSQIQNDRQRKLLLWKGLQEMFTS